MKNSTKRIIAVAVAFSIVAAQSVAFNSQAIVDVNPSVSVDDLLYVNPETGFPESIDGDTITFTQESEWNTTVNDKLADGQSFTINPTPILNAVGSTNDYVQTLKDIVAATADPTATVKSASGIYTITGTLDMQAYVGDDLVNKAKELGYTGLDTSILDNVTYTITLTTDFANSKKVTGKVVLNANGKEYVNEDVSSYLYEVYSNLYDQLTAIVPAGATDDFNTLDEIAEKAFKNHETIDKYADKVKNYTKAQTTYDSADAALAAANGVNSKVPASVSALSSKTSTAVNKAIDEINASDASFTIDATASDIEAVLKDMTNVSVEAASGVYTFSAEITDDEYNDVLAYVTEQVAKLAPEKTVKSVETTKTVSLVADANAYSAEYDVEREVVVVLEDTETTTTTTEETTTTDGGETTTTEETTTTTGDGDTTTTTTTTSGDGSGDGTTTTTTSGDGTTTTTTSGDGTTTTTTSGDGTTTTTTSGEGSGDGTTTTTTASVPSVDEIESVSVVTLAEAESQGIYLSYEDSYDAADLIASVTLNMTSGETVELTADQIATGIKFSSTPAEDYATVVAKKTASGYFTNYFLGEVAMNYTDNDGNTIANVGTASVAVGRKGDADLNGAVQTHDAFVTLMYSTNRSANIETSFAALSNADVEPLIEKLAYLCADIDTESKAGADAEANRITSDKDAFYTLMYTTDVSAGLFQDLDVIDGWNTVMNK